MSLRLTAALQGKLESVVAAEAKAMRQARGRAVRETTADLKGGFRAAVRGGTKGRRLANAVRDKLYSQGGEVEAGIVYSNARKKGARGQVVDLVEILSRGATVRPTRGSWLLIPNPAFARTRSGGYSRRGLKRAQAKIQSAAVGAGPHVAFIPLDGGRRVLIVEERARRSVILGVLVRQVHIPKQFDLASVQRRSEARFPERLLAAWELAARCEA